MLLKVNKRTWFLIGIIIGLILGIIVGKSYLHLIFPKKEEVKESISVHEKSDIKSIIINENAKDDKPIRDTDETKTDTSINKEGESDTLSSNINDTTNIDSLSRNILDTIPQNDSINSSITDTIWSWEDTITLDTIDNYTIDLNADKKRGSSLMKHELLEVRFIQPEGELSDFECMNVNELDSALVDHDVDIDSKTFRVEFWASPINYRAYILTKNKLLLFGIERYSKVKLKYLDSGELLLDYLDRKYVLKCSDNLKPSILK